MYFINSEDRANEALAAFRAKYNMPTVPGLLVARGGEVRVVCDHQCGTNQSLYWIINVSETLRVKVIRGGFYAKNSSLPW